jgi:4-hydroxy-tetrahydrodipicolinate reductase
MTIPVIQWATGATGRHALRMIVEHPDLELAGVIVTDPAKTGRDAGELCGLGPTTGVAASTDVEAVLAGGADVVAYCPLPSARTAGDAGIDERRITDLLRRGFDVVTTVGYLYPKAYGVDVLARLNAACLAGAATLHGTGANPGFLAEVVPLTLARMSARIDRITVVESSQFANYPSPDVILGMMQLGSAPERFEGVDSVYGRWLTGLFSESILLVADALGVELDHIGTELDVELAGQSFDIAAGTIEAGSVAGQRWRWTGIAAATGEPFVVQEAVYRARHDIAPEWAPLGMRVQIDGRPAMLIDQGHDWLSNGLLATAAHLVNAIPAVTAADPGIKTVLDLPAFRPTNATRHLR